MSTAELLHKAPIGAILICADGAAQMLSARKLMYDRADLQVVPLSQAPAMLEENPAAVVMDPELIRMQDDSPMIRAVIRAIELRRTGANAAEPPPKPSDEPATWDLVREDIEARNQAGIAKYGVALKAFVGRDQMTDAYQEALDLVVYLRGGIQERSETISAMREALATESLEPIRLMLEKLKLDR